MIEVVEAGGSSRREGRLSIFREVNNWRLRRTHPPCPPYFGRQACGRADGKRATEGEEEADLWSADMEMGERTCRSGHMRDP